MLNRYKVYYIYCILKGIHISADKNEPTNHLDKSNRQKVVDFIQKYRQNKLIVFVSDWGQSITNCPYISN